jgi:3-keto-5-aminohexanoate cleavage enzyme
MMKTSHEKLIVTVTTANAWIYPGATNYPTTPEEIAETAFQCYEEGASIAHVHLPKNACKKTVTLIREKCDIIIQAGMSSDPIQKRRELFDAKPDMVSIILNHHDEAFPSVEVNRLHPRKEMEDYCRVCRKTGIKSEFEIWHHGSVWNLQYLMKKHLVDPPYFLTLFLGWPGGTWSPPTKDELVHRIHYLPADTVCSVSVMGPDQNVILPFAIELGKHVRIGTEDYPYLKKGVVANNNAELVKKIVKIGKGKGRQITDPSEARTIIGIHKK